MRRDITAFEDALLKEIRDAVGATVRTIKTYDGELSKDGLKKHLARLPSVLVLYGGSKIARAGRRRVEEMRFTVLVSAKSLRAADSAGRTGAAADAYSLLTALGEALDNRILFTDGYFLELVRQKPLWVDSGISVYAAEFTIKQAWQQPVVTP